MPAPPPDPAFLAITTVGLASTGNQLLFGSTSASSPAKQLGKVPSTARCAGGPASMQGPHPNLSYASLPLADLTSHPRYVSFQMQHFLGGGLAALQGGKAAEVLGEHATVRGEGHAAAAYQQVFQPSDLQPPSAAMQWGSSHE
eukprot:318311-Pelagomonas_calceolata.AAC.2